MSRFKGAFVTYCLHVNAFIQLEHHAIDAIFQVSPSVVSVSRHDIDRAYHRVHTCLAHRPSGLSPFSAYAACTFSSGLIGGGREQELRRQQSLDPCCPHMLKERLQSKSKTRQMVQVISKNDKSRVERI